MLIDYGFTTRKKATKANNLYKKDWEFRGTAKEVAGLFVAWRTNCQKHLCDLISRKAYKDLIEIQVDD